MTGDEPRDRRRVRSYVLRAGRMTAGQRQALEAYWPRYGLRVDQGQLDFRQVFGRAAPTVLEIGFGMGDSLAQMVQQRSDFDFIGVEVHGPGVGRLLMQCQQRGLENIRVYQRDAVEVLQQCIPSGSLAGVQIYFPDPWHKKKHHKRRLVQAPLITLLASKLQSGGYLHLATDWQPYAEQMMALVQAETGLCNRAGPDRYSARPQWRPETKFERRGEKLGHEVWDLLFDRIDR